MRLLVARLEIPFWCSFRDPSSVNVHRTFPVPPPTALTGLVANALGLAQDDFSLYRELTWGVRLVRRGLRVEDYWTQLKRYESKARADEVTSLQRARVWDRTPTIRQRLIAPAFEVYASARDEGFLDRAQKALLDPSRPLYLGESDDMVSVEGTRLERAVEVETTVLDSVAPGLYPGAETVNLPITFARTPSEASPVRIMVSVAERIELPASVPALRVNGAHVVLLHGNPSETESDA